MVGIAAGAAAQDVVAAATDQHVIATGAVQFVIAFAAVQDVMGGIAHQAIGTGARLQQHLLDLLHRPQRAVGEADLVDAVVAAGRGVVVQAHVDGDAIAIAVGQQQIAAGAAQADVAGENAVAEPDGFHPAAAGVAGDDPVAAPAQLEAIGIAAVATAQDIVATAADQHIAAGAAVQIVVAALSVQRIVAPFAEDPVVAVAAIQGVVADVADDAVGTAGGLQQHLLDLIHGPQRTVGEADLVDAVVAAGHGIVEQAHVDGDAIAVAVGQQQIAAGAAQADVAGENTVAELDGVHPADAGVVGEDPVAAPAQVEAIGIAAVAAAQDIVATAADQHIVAGAAVQIVIAGLSVQRIVAAFAEDLVVAIAAIQSVVAGVAGDAVGTAGRLQQHQLDLLHGPQRAVGEADHVDAVVAAGRRIVVQPHVDGDAIAIAVGQQQIAAGAAQADVAGENAFAELDGFHPAGAGVVGVDPVAAPAQVEAIGIATVAAAQDVVAAATDQQVVAGTALQLIVAGLAMQRIVAAFAEDLVVAIAAVQGVVGGVADDAVGSAGRLQQHLLDLIHGPQRAVGEADHVDAVVAAGRRIVVQTHVDGDAIAIAVGQHQVVGGPAQADVAGENAVAELDGVHPAAAAVVGDDLVAAPAQVEAIGIAAISAAKGIVAAAADQQVVAGTSVQVVVAGLSVQRIVAAFAEDLVVAIAATHDVIGGIAGDAVGSTGRLQQHLLDLFHGPDGAVVEMDLVDTEGGARQRIVVEPHVHLDPIAIGMGQEQIAVRSAHPDIAGQDAGTEADDVGAASAGVIVVEPVAAPAQVEMVGVAAETTAQLVVAGTTDQQVVAAFAFQVVVALLSSQHVAAIAADKPVVADPAGDFIVTAVAAQPVIAFLADKEVRACTAVDRIGRGPAPQPILAAAAVGAALDQADAGLRQQLNAPGQRTGLAHHVGQDRQSGPLRHFHLCAGIALDVHHVLQRAQLVALPFRPQRRRHARRIPAQALAAEHRPERRHHVLQAHAEGQGAVDRIHQGGMRPQQRGDLFGPQLDIDLGLHRAAESEAAAAGADTITADADQSRAIEAFKQRDDRPQHGVLGGLPGTDSALALCLHRLRNDAVVTQGPPAGFALEDLFAGLHARRCGPQRDDAIDPGQQRIA